MEVFFHMLKGDVKLILFWFAILVGLESYLFLNIHYFGVSIHPSRLIQIFILPFVIYKIFLKIELNKIVKKYIFYIFYFIFMYLFISIIQTIFDKTGFYLFLFFKAFSLYLYQVIFFIIFPVLLIKNINHLIIFLINLKFVFLFAIVLGFIDLCIRVFFDYDLIPRSLLDQRDVGPRFHGLFGEPRDAAVVLGFAIYLEFLLGYVREIPIRKIFKSIYFYCFLLIMTQSLSMALGFALSGGFVFLFLVRGLLRRLLLILVVMILLYVFTITSYRIGIYILELDNLITAIAIGNYQSIPKVFVGQMPNILPFSYFYERLANGHLWSFLFGSGYSHVVVMNMLSGYWVGESVNTHANISRWVIDFGLVGSSILLYIMISPILIVKNYLKGNPYSYWLAISGFFVIGLVLSHRSYISFAVVGITLSFLNLISLNFIEKKTKKPLPLKSAL